MELTPKMTPIHIQKSGFENPSIVARLGVRGSQSAAATDGMAQSMNLTSSPPPDNRPVRPRGGETAQLHDRADRRSPALTDCSGARLASVARPPPIGVEVCLPGRTLVGIEIIEPNGDSCPWDRAVPRVARVGTERPLDRLMRGAGFVFGSLDDG